MFSYIKKGAVFAGAIGSKILRLTHHATDGYIEVNGKRLYALTTAITANVTTTSAPAGSHAVTTNATGRGSLFYSDGTKWQVQVTGATTKASGAEVDTGTDDAKFVTAKAIADSRVYSTPSSLPELPATPTEQDIADALVTLGLVTQAE